MSDREIIKSALASTPDCLSPEQLEAVASSENKDHPHVRQCPRCQAELSLLQSFESSEALPGEGAAVAWITSDLDRRLDQIKNPSRRNDVRARSASASSWFARRFGTGRMRFAAVGAACAVISVAGLILRSSKEPELRAGLGSQSEVYRSGTVQVVSPVGDVGEKPRTLEWQAFQGAQSYKVEVMEVDQSLLWSTETKYTTVTIENGVRARIVLNKPILWRVTAIGPTGNILAASSTQRFLFREHAGSTDALPPQ
ncbi:MAG TPA: hypothetical protein VH437_13990 [Terriglobales bacterium]|jgi:hypothetical protein